MHNFTLNLENPRALKPLGPNGRPGSTQGASAAAREMELQRLGGMKIAQSAIQGIGMSTREIRGTWTNDPNHALAVSLLFTRATHQRIMLGTEPGHVLSTSLLYNSLLHDSRFMQVRVSRSAPGDIVVQSGLNPDGYAGIVVDHGRIIGDSSNGVQNHSSLVEIQRCLPPTLLFRYIGVQKHPGYTLATLANAGYNPDESRVPADQPGGGQWTTGGASPAPSTPLVSGANPAISQEASLRVAAPETPKNYYVNKTLRVLQVRKPDGSVAVVKTKVKTQEQADLLGVPVGTKVPVFVPPGKDPQAMVDEWRGEKTKNPVDFAVTWMPGGDNDYKKKNGAIYDAYGNFEYGATGAAYGFTKSEVVAGGDAAALVQHHVHNNPINRTDIEAGHDVISQGGKLRTVPYKWSPQAGAN